MNGGIESLVGARVSSIDQQFLHRPTSNPANPYYEGVSLVIHFEDGRRLEVDAQETYGSAEITVEVIPAKEQQ